PFVEIYKLAMLSPPREPGRRHDGPWPKSGLGSAGSEERGMSFREYEDYDMLGLAELIRRRAVSADEVLAAAIDRVERGNPQLNAIVLRLDDRARAQIAGGLPDGPLSGVPYLLKDLYQPYAGAPVSNGSRLFDGFVAPTDGTLTERLKAAGIVILGRTNTSEFGLNAATEPVRFGPTRNPWNLGRSAGGAGGRGAAGRAARRRRGGRRRHGARGACHRRRRLDPCSGLELRAVRAEADARAQPRGSRSRRGLERHGRRPCRDPQRARLRGAARCDQRARAGRS